MKNQKKYIEVWGDNIDLIDLFVSILISSVTVMVAVYFSPDDRKFVYGLVAAVFAFVINIFLTKPKRIVTESEEK